MAQKSGFFNALESGGVYDRTYNADDYNDNLAAIISTGVRRSGTDDLKVSASGLVVSVNVGRAWIKGHWYYNDTAVELVTITPPTGDKSRVDGVYLTLDTNTETRSIVLTYKAGTPSNHPAPPACTRTGGVYEIQLAAISVSPGATSVTVTDTRGTQSLCGWITTPVGYEDYFTSLDSQFTTWFEDVKDELASVTLFKQYIWSTDTTESTASVTFSIPQYDPTGTDIIQVYYNGAFLLEDTDYTLSGSTVTFTESIPEGSEIIVLCYKSIDGTGLGSVSDEVTALQNQMQEVDATLDTISDCYYICNGSTDNEELSSLVQTFLNASTTDGKRMSLHIVGTFGITNPASGSGTGPSPYIWLKFSAQSSTNRRVYLDFKNCSPIAITPADGSYNNVISGGNIDIEGLVLTATNSTNASIIGLTGATLSASPTFKSCDIKITAAFNTTVFFAGFGTFTDCKIDVKNYGGNAAALHLGASSCLVRVFGGAFYAYTGASAGTAIAFSIANSASNATLIAVGANIPTKSVQSLFQKNSYVIQAGYFTAIGLITVLPSVTTGATAASVTGTIPLDKD